MGDNGLLPIVPKWTRLVTLLMMSRNSMTSY